MEKQEHRASGHDRSDKRSKKKHLIFSLEDRRYGIPLHRIKEVIAMTKITPIPKVPSFYRGMINLRGQIISVIDLRLKLGIKEAPMEPKKTTIIISHVGDIVVGTIVDEVVEVIGYEDSQIELSSTQRKERSGEGVYGVAKDAEGSLTLLIDIEKALDNTEFKVLRQNAA